MHELSIKQIRRAPLVIFGFLVFLLAMLITITYTSIDVPVSVDVRVSRDLPEKTYHRVNLGENDFVTGMEGQVSLTPKSFKEAFILQNIVSDNLSFSLFDLVYLFVLTCILYWMLHDIEPENLFNWKVLKGLRIFSVMIVVYMGKGIIQTHITNYFLNEITGGQFQARLTHLSMMPYFVSALFFQLLPQFILKAQKVQREQYLTI